MSPLEFIQIFGCFITVILVLLIRKTGVVTLVATKCYKKFVSSVQSRFGALVQHSVEPARRELVGKLKESLENVAGDVLEIGIGGGANLEFYPPGISLIAVDQNPFNEEILRVNFGKFSSSVKLKKYIVASSGDMALKPGGNGIPEQSVAAVLCTYLLCSLTEEEIRKTLSEVKRVLKPGGRFLFLEHVLDKPGTMRHYVQKLVAYLKIWIFLFDGCHVDRNTLRYLEEAGFKSLSCKEFCVRPPPEKWSLKAHIALFISAWNICGYAEV